MPPRTSSRRHHWWYRQVFLLALALCLEPAAIADVNTWTAAYDDEWNDGFSWSLGVPPSLYESTDSINNAGSKTVTIDDYVANIYPDTMAVSNVSLSATAGQFNTLYLGAPDTNTPLEILQALTVSSGGALIVTDGIVQVDGMAGGQFVTDGGVWLYDDGSLIATGAAMRVGVATTNGVLVEYGGTLLGESLTIGSAPNGAGAVYLVGGTAVIATGSANGLLNVHSGFLSLDGGDLTVDEFAATNGTHATVYFTSGSLHTAATTISNATLFTVGNGTTTATLDLRGGTHSFASGLFIQTNSMLSGCGTITGAVLINGIVLANCGGTITFDGSVTNNGTIRAIAGTSLEAYGTVVNNGTIDIINGGPTNFHGAFINHGVVLNASNVKVSQANRSGQDFLVEVPSFTGHTYQLQASASLTSTNWTNIGSPQAGNGAVLTFTDSGGATNSPARFYRVDCTAP